MTHNKILTNRPGRRRGRAPISRPDRDGAGGAWSSLGRVVHLTAEYGSLARTGGLAEAVAGLAEAQSLTSAVPPVVILPLHDSVRASGRLVPLDLEVDAEAGAERETARVWRLRRSPRREPLVLAIELSRFDRPGLYGEPGTDYDDNPVRFAMFVRAALAALPEVAPDASIVHAHDWPASLAPVLLRTVLSGEPFHRGLTTVLTVHNAGYQGRFPRGSFEEIGLPPGLLDGLEPDRHGRFSWLEAGLREADMVTTVSETHAAELRTPLGGCGLHQRFEWLGDRMVGLTNGVDQRRWNPRTDTTLAERFSSRDRSGRGACREALLREYGFAAADPGPIAGMIARLVPEKGLGLLEPMVERFPEVRLVVLGVGLADQEERMRQLAGRFPDRVRAPVGFSDRLERQLIAGGDLLLVPSQFEPCGLAQLHAQRYGAVPVVRRVGGLAETVVDGDTGFVFDDYTSEAFAGALSRALARFADRPSWDRTVRRAMATDVGWGRALAGYRDVYRRAGQPAHR